ncbi:MAG: class I SAM-dependent methyltransferase [Rubripirellula sp.]|jgi:SAM-dependent methyltransferase|nr:class I SAM-dependent methyltransferase [Rubripirellula sp.]
MLENYRIDSFGVIHQIHHKPMLYDREYLSYYENLEDRTIKLGYQRLGWLLGILGRIPKSVLEIGYGTGSFIEAAQISGVSQCVGCDVTRYPLPDNVDFMSWDESLAEDWDVVAMFDVLEHIPDLSFLRRLRAKVLAIAVPYCRWAELGDDWFRDWRMRLPDEHLHHFNPDSLCAMLASYGFECEQINTFEDGIRLRPGETGPNILCGLFQRRHSDQPVSVFHGK